MMELAHFLQFLSFSFGLLAIYVGIQLSRQTADLALKPYLRFIVGVNIIVFVHVLEAFSKIIFDNELLQTSVRPLFFWAVYPLALVRLYMAALFISFCREYTGGKPSPKYFQSAIAAFVVFIGLTAWFYFSPRDMSTAGEISVWIIHFILFLSILLGAFILIRNSNRTRDPKIVRTFGFFILFYALGYIFSRTLNSWIIPASEHLQMLSLGLLALAFNSFNVLGLKKLFKTNEAIAANQSSQDTLNGLFRKYNITNREQEIIKLLCEGKTNKEIGEILFISAVTVRDHNSNIFRKTNVTNRTQLAGLFQAYYH